MVYIYKCSQASTILKKMYSIPSKTFVAQGTTTPITLQLISSHLTFGLAF